MSTRQRISKYLPILRWTNELLDAGVDLYLARVADPVRDMFDRSGFSSGWGRVGSTQEWISQYLPARQRHDVTPTQS